MSEGTFKTIIYSRTAGVADIILNRPEARNAINLQMIRELNSALEELRQDPTVRLIHFQSRGSHFCAGADLQWMCSGISQEEDLLNVESLELAGLFRKIREAPAVTVCSVKGQVPGGAIGLLAASDLVVAERTVVLSFPEVKLGLIPATIAPHVIRKAGIGRTTDWMMTGRKITSEEALETGLIQRICELGSLEAYSRELIGELLSGGVRALRELKGLFSRLEDLRDPLDVDRHTSKLIAAIRVSEEGQEGMKAFLEKRRPEWDEEN